MTTACGSTTSSPDTPLTLEEAPFEVYLKILREEGLNDDADASELFYVEMLTGVEFEQGKRFTREQVMATPFNKLVKAVEKIIESATAEIQSIQRELPPPPLSGKVLQGKGADELSPEQLYQLAVRQAQLHEEEKARVAMR